MLFIPRNVYLKNRQITKTCSVCFEDKYVILNKYLKISKLEELNSHCKDGIIRGPCPNQEHIVCIKCLRNRILNYNNHPINFDYDKVRCFSPIDTCFQGRFNEYFYENYGFKNILSKEEFQRFYDHYTFFKNKKYISVVCEECCEFNIAFLQDINFKRFGFNIFKCNYCEASICIDCNKTLNYNITNCFSCMWKTENNFEKKENKYIIKPLNERKSLYDSFYTNDELTEEIVLKRINEIISNHHYIRCPVCYLFISKTEKCNGLNHCGYEICNICCRIGNPELDDHWSAVCNYGCPRFDNDPYWGTSFPSFLCREDTCYNHTLGECKLEEHVLGVKEMNAKVKEIAIYNVLKSLPEDLSYYIVGKHEQFEKFRLNLILSHNSNYYFNVDPDFLA